MSQLNDRRSEINLDNNPTIEQLRDLVSPCDDAAGHHILWVKKNGDVAISRLSIDQDSCAFEESHPEMQLRFPTFLAGNEYVGPDAASDADWMSELFERLQDKWNVAKGKQAVEFADNF